VNHNDGLNLNFPGTHASFSAFHMAVTRASLRGQASSTKPMKLSVARKQPELLHKIVADAFRLQAHSLIAAKVAGNCFPTATLVQCFEEIFFNSKLTIL